MRKFIARYASGEVYRRDLSLSQANEHLNSGWRVSESVEIPISVREVPVTTTTKEII